MAAARSLFWGRWVGFCGRCWSMRDSVHARGCGKETVREKGCEKKAARRGRARVTREKGRAGTGRGYSRSSDILTVRQPAATVCRTTWISYYLRRRSPGHTKAPSVTDRDGRGFRRLRGQESLRFTERANLAPISAAISVSSGCGIS